VSDSRSSIPAATQAALWALSNGTCYAPGCPFPVIHEVRPGVYKKNAQIAHIHGVKGPRRRPSLPPEHRDSFSNLLLLCLAHHGEVDDVNYGEKLYPAEILRRWKSERESEKGQALAILNVPSEEGFFDYLVSIFESPIKRLESIASQLEKTGTINAASVAELQQIVQLLNNSSVGVDNRTAMTLANAADIFAGLRLEQTAVNLMNAADMLASSPNIANHREY
jgi:hypothetical protein